MNVNGKEYSWQSIILDLFGAQITDFKGISYSDEIEGREHVFGASRLPRGRTAGRYKPGDASLTFYLSGFQQLLATLPDGWGDVEGEIVVQFSEGDDIHTHVIEGVQLSGADHKAEDGTDASEVEIKFTFMRIKRDGKYLVADQ